MELIFFNTCGEFRWSPEGPVSLIQSPHPHVCAPGIFSDLLRSVQMLTREWGAESNGKLSHLFIPNKTAARFLSLRWKTCLRQNCSIGPCSCSKSPVLVQNTLMMIIKVRPMIEYLDRPPSTAEIPSSNLCHFMCSSKWTNWSWVFENKVLREIFGAKRDEITGE